MARPVAFWKRRRKVRSSNPVLGQVCGVVLNHPSEKTLYSAGDTIWNQHVAQAIARHRPEVIVLNARMALFIGFTPHHHGSTRCPRGSSGRARRNPDRQPLEVANHCILSRADLRAFAAKEGFAASLRAPADGESIAL